MEHREADFVHDESSGTVREESTVVNDTGAAPVREASVVKSSTPARRHVGHLPPVWDHRRPPADPVGAQAPRSEFARRVRELHPWGDRLPARSIPRAAADHRQRADRARAISHIRDPHLLAARPRPRAFGGDHALPQRHGFAAQPFRKAQASVGLIRSI
jgi:hypothetical protein